MELKKKIDFKEHPWFLFQYLKNIVFTFPKKDDPIIEEMNDLFEIALSINSDESISTAKQFFTVGENILIDDFFYKDLLIYYKFYMSYAFEDSRIIEEWENYRSNHTSPQKEFLAASVRWTGDEYLSRQMYQEYIDELKNFEYINDIGTKLNINTELFETEVFLNQDFDISYLIKNIEEIERNSSLASYYQKKVYGENIAGIVEYYFFIEKDYVEVVKYADNYLKDLFQDFDPDLLTPEALFRIINTNYLSNILLGKIDNAKENYLQFKNATQSFESFSIKKNFYKISHQTSYILNKNKNKIIPLSDPQFEDFYKFFNNSSGQIYVSKEGNIVFNMFMLEGYPIWWEFYNRLVCRHINEDTYLNEFSEKNNIDIRKLRTNNFLSFQRTMNRSIQDDSLEFFNQQ